MRYAEIISESSTIEKFWINAISGNIEKVDREHFEEIPFEYEGNVDDIMINGWVRGGMSNYTNKLHLESCSLKFLRSSIPYLLNEYAPDGIEMDWRENGQAKDADLDMKQVDVFLRNGRIPRK